MQRPFQLVHDFLLLFVGQVFEVIWQLFGHLGLAVRLGVFQDFATLVAHAFEAAPRCANTGSESALQHGHGKAEGATASGIVLFRLR